MPTVFERQVGPLPLGVWAMIGLGGVGIAYFMRRNASRKAVVPTPGAADQAASGPIGLGGVVPLGSFAGAPTSYKMPDAVPVKFVTNDEWAMAVTVDMISRGYAPNLVDNAVRKYLGGRVLTREEAGVIEIALRLKGPPPYPVPIAPAEPPPVVKPPAPQPDNSIQAQLAFWMSKGVDMATALNIIAHPDAARAWFGATEAQRQALIRSGQ